MTKKTTHRSGNTNTVKLGMRTNRNLLLPGEAIEEFENLLKAYIEQLVPQTTAEHQAVHRVVGLRWKLMRADAHENGLLSALITEMVAGSTEKKNLDLITRATAAISALVETLPMMMEVPVAEAEHALTTTLGAVLAMVDAVAAALDLPFGVLSDLSNAINEVQTELLVLPPVAGPATNPESYKNALSGLLVAAQKAHQAVYRLQPQCQAAVDKLGEGLRCSVALNVTTVRRLDRYRTALARSLEQELDHLDQLRELRRKGLESSFGSGLPVISPPVELKLVQ